MAAPDDLLELLRDLVIKQDPTTQALTAYHLSRPLSSSEVALLVAYKDEIKAYYLQEFRRWRLTLTDTRRIYLYTEVLHTVAEMETELQGVVGALFFAVEPLI